MSSIQSYILRVHNLGIGYPAKMLQSDISFDLKKGEVVGLIGRNGKGKSTLLKTIAGLLPALAGNIFLDGHNIKDLSNSSRATRVSIVLTQRTQLGGIDVRTLIQMGRYPYSGRYQFVSKDNFEITNNIIEKLELTHLAAKPLAQLSDGEQQKVMIARALAQQTPLILMDEPTAFLDFVAKREIFQLLRKIADEQKITLFFSSHDLEMIREFADRFITLD